MTDNQEEKDDKDFEREPITKCAYCEKDFETELDRGIHQADEHVDPDERYETKKKRQHNPYTNIVDEWKTNKDSAERGMV